MQDSNVYEALEDEPKICSFSLIPYEQKLPSSTIGQFKNAREPEQADLNSSELRLKHHKEFEREYVVRKELAIEEEKFYKDTIDIGIASNLFNPDEGLAGLPERE